jgi:hypothetical protein
VALVSPLVFAPASVLVVSFACSRRAKARLGIGAAPGRAHHPEPTMLRLLLFVFLLLTSGCESTSSDDETPRDDPGVVYPTDEPSLEFEHGWSEEALCAVEGDPNGCCADGRVALPERAASALDLRSLPSGALGTCGDPTKRVLPDDPAAYPLMVLLPAFEAPDPACETACAGRGRSTSFGIVLELPQSLVEQYRPRIVAPDPWRYVYDHNSLAGDCCLDGYQEHGERACVRTNYGGSIGFATGATTVAVHQALIELEPGEDGVPPSCCPYLADER